MGRYKRPYLPGTIFHLVSRMHRREPLLVADIRADVASLIQWSVGRTDAQLIAYVVMPNHLHLVVRQGRSELSSVMQPLLRRVAHLVQRRSGFEGTVVERRFRDRPCRTADHVREVLLYTHLNPWRAGLCDADLGYPSTTHAAYLPGSDPTPFGIDRQAQLRVLQLFADAPGLPRDHLCKGYLRWLAWRMQRDRDGDNEGSHPCRPPAAIEGDSVWRRHFDPVLANGADPVRQALPDLRDYMATQIQQLAPGCTVEQLRGSRTSRRAARWRRRLIQTAAERGYRTGELAGFFAVSPTTVSTAKYAPLDPLP